MILAIDTSTSRSSVGLLDVQAQVSVSRHRDGGRHAEVLVPLISELLQSVGVERGSITSIVVGVGPGPFTGLRVGIMTARAMAHALDIPVVGVCSLDAIAREQIDDEATALTVLTPARRTELYCATYDSSGTRIGGPSVVSTVEAPEGGRVVGLREAVFPDAIRVAQVAMDAASRGEVALTVAAAAFEDDAGSRGSSLEGRLRGHVLLSPEALYLRRPDAMPPASVVGTAPVGTAPRRMRWWDLDDVLAIEQQVFPTTAWSPGTFWSELAGVPDSRSYVVVTDGSGVSGYAGLAAFAPDAEVQTIAVAPRAQGTGLGAVLLDELIAEARRRSCTRLMLEVRADNASALALYASRAFEVNGRRRDYYGAGLDAVLMERRL